MIDIVSQLEKKLDISVKDKSIFLIKVIMRSEIMKN